MAVFNLLLQAGCGRFALYFCSNRTGGYGGFDLWKVPIIPFVDLSGDGIVDATDMCIMVDHWGTDNRLCDDAVYSKDAWLFISSLKTAAKNRRLGARMGGALIDRVTTIELDSLPKKKLWRLLLLNVRESSGPTVSPRFKLFWLQEESLSNGSPLA